MASTPNSGAWCKNYHLWMTSGLTKSSKPIFDSCTVEAKSVAVESQMLPIERNGFLEETFYTWSLTPLFGGTDRVMGFYSMFVDIITRC